MSKSDLTYDELICVSALVSLSQPVVHTGMVRNRALRALNDWNGSGRISGGVGISTVRSRTRSTRGADEHAKTSCGGRDAPLLPPACDPLR